MTGGCAGGKAGGSGLGGGRGGSGGLGQSLVVKALKIVREQRGPSGVHEATPTEKVRPHSRPPAAHTVTSSGATYATGATVTAAPPAMKSIEKYSRKASSAGR